MTNLANLCVLPNFWDIWLNFAQIFGKILANAKCNDFQPVPHPFDSPRHRLPMNRHWNDQYSRRAA